MLRGVHDVESVIHDWGFWTALVLGGLGTAFVWARARHAHPEPGVAVVAVVAALVALRIDDRLPLAAVVGVALLVAGEWFTRELVPGVRVLALVPGALVLGASLPHGWPFWARLLVVVTAAGGGALAVAAGRCTPRWLPVLFAVGAVGVYVCVPDTEAPKCLLGALVATALVAWWPDAVPTVGFAALTGLFAWVAAYGGVGRSGAVVGGIACLGVIVLVPAFVALTTSREGVTTLVLVQCALVVFVARVAGFEDGAGIALGLSLVGFAVAAVGLAWAARIRA